MEINEFDRILNLSFRKQLSKHSQPRVYVHTTTIHRFRERKFFRGVWRDEEVAAA